MRRYAELEYVHDSTVSCDDIAKKYNIPIWTVRNWSQRFEWGRKRREWNLTQEQDSLDAHRKHIQTMRTEYAPRVIAATVKAYLAVMDRIVIDETTGIVRPDSERDSATRSLVIQMMQRLLGMHDEQIDIQRKLLAAVKPGTEEAKTAAEAVSVGELSQQAIETYGFVRTKKEDAEATEDDDEDLEDGPPTPPAQDPDELVGSLVP